jgi:hypothetical protein
LNGRFGDFVQSGNEKSVQTWIKGGRMGVNFYLDRERMLEEVERCVALDRLDNLLSFCNSCSFKAFKASRLPECLNCKVQRGINALQRRKTNGVAQVAGIKK